MIKTGSSPGIIKGITRSKCGGGSCDVQWNDTGGVRKTGGSSAGVTECIINTNKD
jgi:hypothetical protein